MTRRHTSASPRRTAPEFCRLQRPSKNRGRREGRVPAAPMAPCEKMHGSGTTGLADASRPSLRSGFTASFVLSPVTGLVCHRHLRDAKHHRKLDASIGAPGPHDFAVRKRCRSSSASPRPPHPALNVRDDAYAPLVSAGRAKHAADLAFRQSEEFFRQALDKPSCVEAAYEIRFLAQRDFCVRERAQRAMVISLGVICPTGRRG